MLEVAPFERLRVADYGDVDVSPVSIEQTFEAVERELDPVVAAGVIPLAVGGDHSITLPVLRALARRHGPLALVHFDSHPDTWGEYAGSYHYHGSTFRRAIEEGIVDGARLIQIGIRGPVYGRDDFEFHAEHGLEVIRIGDVKEHGVARALERVARLRGRPRVLLLRHRRGGPGVCAGHGHARGRRAHQLRGAEPRARAPGPRPGRRRRRRGGAAVRRARAPSRACSPRICSSSFSACSRSASDSRGLASLDRGRSVSGLAPPRGRAAWARVL